MLPKTLLVVAPHPDDESLGFGGTLAKYSQEQGISTAVIGVTRGQAGGDPQVREAELRCAVTKLGVDTLKVLDFEDGQLPAVPDAIGIQAISQMITSLKPQVVVTFGPDGGYGHPDHIAVSHWVTQAVKSSPKVKKLYYLASKADFATTFLKEFGPIILNGQKLSPTSHPDSYITTTIDTSGVVDIKFAASNCHQSQLHNIRQFERLRALQVQSMITTDYYHLAFSRGHFSLPETDLFAGI